MSNLKILVWKNKEGVGEADVEVRIPTRLVKWVPRLMKFVPKKAKEEQWGSDINFNEMFVDIENLVKEAVESGQQEIMDVKTKDSYVKVMVET